MNKPMILLTTLALVQGAALAADEPVPDNAPPTFASADVNGDGRVSWEEYRNRMLQVFHKMDRNHDGQLTARELPAVKDQAARPAKASAVTLDAFNASSEKLFKKTDTNGDGLLSPSEWAGGATQSGN